MNSTLTDRPLDIIGIGVGPFNLGLAALLDPVDTLRAKFFESKPRFEWHAGLLMDDCALQVPFMADLVTMVDPLSRWSYLNYLHEHRRLYHFYFYENFHIPRRDYDRYCRWVSERLSSIVFSRCVVEVRQQDDLFHVTAQDTESGALSRHIARNLVLGVGTTPFWPSAARDCASRTNCIHSADYMFRKSELQHSQTITIVGGGQSAAEIVLDLLQTQFEHGYELQWLSRSNGFFPMEYSKLGLEHFSPDYIEHFHGLTERRRDDTRSQQGHWYKGISFSTIARIYDHLYERTGSRSVPIVMQARSQLEQLEQGESGIGYRLHFRHLDLDEQFVVDSDAVVLATGYQYRLPDCLDALRPALHMDAAGRPVILRDYSISSELRHKGRIFVQNGEIHSHGIGAQDLGLGPYRSASIINTLLGHERYPISTRNVFQRFGIEPKWKATVSSPI